MMRIIISSKTWG